MQHRDIITPFNDTVNFINEAVIAKIDAVEKTYYSSDYISKSSLALTFLGMPNHELHLKIGCVIMLMRNISQVNELCNGTRLVVTQLCSNVIEAKIILGSDVGSKFTFPGLY